MKVQFYLMWAPPGKITPRAFKHTACYFLLREYAKKIIPFTSCELNGRYVSSRDNRTRSRVWVCDRKGKELYSSEKLAASLKGLLDSGTHSLQIIIGGPNGISEEQLAEFGSSVKWSFGPLTLPHELASVVAGEQIYRAFTIMRGLPYHLGHP